MNLPTLPTDNLYKFIAIAGITIVVTSFLSISFQMHEMAILMFDYNTEALVVRENVDNLGEKVTNLSTLEKDEIIIESQSILKETNNQELKLAELEGVRQKNTFLFDDFKENFYMFKKFIYLGFGITVYGFILWYLKLQQYLDKIIKKEAEK